MVDAIVRNVELYQQSYSAIFSSSEKIEEFIRRAQVAPALDENMQPMGRTLLTDKHMAFINQFKAGTLYNILSLDENNNPKTDDKGRLIVIPVDGGILRQASAIALTHAHETNDAAFIAIRNQVLHMSPDPATTDKEKECEKRILELASQLGSGITKYNKMKAQINIVPAVEGGKTTDSPAPAAGGAKAIPATNGTGAIDALKKSISESDRKLFASLYNPTDIESDVLGLDAKLPKIDAEKTAAAVVQGSKKKAAAL